MNMEEVKKKLNEKKIPVEMEKIPVEMVNFLEQCLREKE
jgi:hypothetical protein